MRLAVAAERVAERVLVVVFFNLNYFTQTQLSNNLFAFIKNIMFMKQNIGLTQMFSQVFFKMVYSHKHSKNWLNHAV